jgi:tetratricopeptide (TPR) repeat protein
MIKLTTAKASLASLLVASFLPAATASAEFDRHYEVGKDFLTREQYKLAVDEFTQALKASPSPVALIDRGTAYSELKNYPAALADLDKALLAAPNSVMGYTVRGVVFLRTGKAEKAIADFDRALAIKPDDKYAVVNRAGAYLMLDDPSKFSQKTVEWLDRTGWKSDFACHATVLTCLGYKLSHNVKQCDALSTIGLKKLDRLLWPYPVLKYFVGKESVEKVLTHSEDSTYDFAQAQAFLGLDAYSRNDLSTAKQKFDFVGKHGVINSVEYWLCKFYLAKIQAAESPALPVAKPADKKPDDKHGYKPDTKQVNKQLAKPVTSTAKSVKK